MKWINKFKSKTRLSNFNKWLTLWVLICMGIGLIIGHFLPSVEKEMNKWTIADISIPIAVLIWIMIYPVMLKMDFKQLFAINKSYIKGIGITTIVNWAIKPFMMYGIALLFFRIFYKNLLSFQDGNGYLSGLIILAAAPCTAMIFVWSKLVKGDHNFTLSQAIINDTLIMILFIPIVGLLLHVSNVKIPWTTLGYSILFFIVIPLVLAITTRLIMRLLHKQSILENKIIKTFDVMTMAGLLITLVLIFMFQTNNIFQHPLAIVLICAPIIIQVLITFSIAYLLNYCLCVDQKVAGPSSTIAGSNFFELALAVAIALFGTSSLEALAVMVGIIVEVPLMLILVKIVNKTKHWYLQRQESHIKHIQQRQQVCKSTPLHDKEKHHQNQ